MAVSFMCCHPEGAHTRETIGKKDTEEAYVSRTSALTEQNIRVLTRHGGARVLHGAITEMPSESAMTMEKSTAFLDAMRDRRMHDALTILNMGGAPVDPNCVYRHRLESHECCCPEPFETSQPALCLAVWAICKWDVTNSQVVGRGCGEDAAFEIVQILLDRGANVDGMTGDVDSGGAYPDRLYRRSALWLALQTHSPRIVKVLLDAGANPDIGIVEESFQAHLFPCEDALKLKQLSGRMMKNLVQMQSMLNEARAVRPRDQSPPRIAGHGGCWDRKTAFSAPAWQSAGVKSLILTCKLVSGHDAGSMLVVCTAISGEELANVLCEDEGADVAWLRSALATQLEQPVCLLSSDARILEDNELLTTALAPLAETCDNQVL
mmetsp:Transcript_140509/g.262041  ORF Transcript_140509/g.262041 Transcript_140509/m.262041 type:complete len:379 (-) Transcript_140509:27-1163(-)